jgi:hypothetical protein
MVAARPSYHRHLTETHIDFDERDGFCAFEPANDDAVAELLALAAAPVRAAPVAVIPTVPVVLVELDGVVGPGTCGPSAAGRWPPRTPWTPTPSTQTAPPPLFVVVLVMVSERKVIVVSNGSSDQWQEQGSVGSPSQPMDPSRKLLWLGAFATMQTRSSRFGILLWRLLEPLLHSLPPEERPR